MKRREGEERKRSQPKPRVNARKMAVAAVAAAAHLKLIQLKGPPSCISPFSSSLRCYSQPPSLGRMDGWKGEKETVNEGQDASAAAERKADFTTPLDDDDAREVCQKTWSSAAPRIAKALAAKLAAADNVRTMWFMQDNIIYWS